MSHHDTSRRTRRLGLLLAAGVALAACSSGPVDQAELCVQFVEFDEAVAGGNVGWGNPLFDAAEDLGDMATRFQAQPLYGDAAALQAIADSEFTDMDTLRNASMHIAAVCDRPPVGLGGMFG